MAEEREAHRLEDIEALKARLESDKIFHGNELKKLQLKKEAAIALSATHADQAVRYLHCFSSILLVHVSVFPAL